MTVFSQGKYALAISDRSGMAFPYNEMVREWNGAMVHIIQNMNLNQPQLDPKPTSADPQALQRARPARTEFGTQDFLPLNPFTTAGNTTLTISFPNGALQVDDVLRFTNIKEAVGGVSIARLKLQTTLNGNITDTATTITLTDGSNFPTSGFIMIKKINSVSGLYENEVIEYTGRSSNNLTGCVRGKSAPYRGITPPASTAGSHDSGATVFGSFKVASLIGTSYVNDANTTVTDYNSFTLTLPSAASGSATGGGFNCVISPLNIESL
jgi:primosomal replication protein N